MPLRVEGDASQTGIMGSDVFRAWLVHTTLVYLLMQMNVNKIIPTLLESPSTLMAVHQTNLEIVTEEEG